ncbi:MAG TPA: pyridoxal-phosphate dependent enzyme [Acidimicrobiia bacterium]|nr:pyridoxal-phosphate dependent enzyme [Acidimicrobiia bacterium]
MTVHRRTPTGGLPLAPVPDPTALDDARRIVIAAHPPTPMSESLALSQEAGRSIHLKLEGMSAVRSFKFRGALAAVADVAARHPAGRLVTASTGNHGQGIAFAGRRFGLSVVVCSPTSVLPEKREAMEALGARVVVGGESLSEAEERARHIAADEDGVYLEDGESPHLMAGAATVVTEMLEQQPDLDAIVVPVGGGNLIAASLLAVAHLGADVRIVGVQSSEAPGATLSWIQGSVVSRPCRTYAGGLATERPGRLSLEVMTRLLDTMILVTDADLVRMSGQAFRTLGLVVEGAAAAPLAALRLHPEAIAGERVGLIISGSWLSAGQLDEALGTGS